MTTAAAPATRSRTPVLAGVLFAVATLAWTAPAEAATSSIDHVEPQGDLLDVVVSLEDLPMDAVPDVDSVTATFNGEPIDSSAQLLSQAGDTFKRTAILALDVSQSMKGARFAEAKAAARTFLDHVPHGVHVGLVTFADEVRVVERPTLDNEAVRTSIDNLGLSRQTRLYDGITEAVGVAGEEGARNVLVLSDGRDTSPTKLSETVEAITSASAKVDVVALAQSPEDESILSVLARAGNGRLLSAEDPEALSAVFADEASILAKQVLVSVRPSDDIVGEDGSLAITLQVSGSPVTDDAFVTIPDSRTEPGAVTSPKSLQPLQPRRPRFDVPPWLMYAGLAAATLGAVLILALALPGRRDSRQDAVDRSIEAYTRKGALRLAAAQAEADRSRSARRQAVAVAQSVLGTRTGVEAALGTRLEAAGLAVKPAEWLLIHAGVGVGLGLLGLLVGGGSILPLLMGLLIGLVGPWLFLGFKRSRRLAAFQAQLADTLQLMAGSLSAGLSLAQSVDTVVKEGIDPVAAEFRRALVEARLGVEIDDALTGVGERMQSVDFEWVVMAIRIQREVGGNLAELFTKVGETIREREYLERQVKTLSAEGRLSVWILGGLPPTFIAYLAVVNPAYLRPMVSNPLGWAMLVVLVVLLTVGIFWMKKVVKVEV